MKKTCLGLMFLFVLSGLPAFSSCSNNEDGSSKASSYAPTNPNDFNFGYYEELGGYSLQDYHGKEQEVFVPLEVELNGIKAPVVEIHSYAFANRDIETVHLGTSIYRIGAFAFHESNIKNLYVTGNLIDIDPDAFTNCQITFNNKDGINYLPARFGKYGFVINYVGTINDSIHLPEECEGVYKNVFGGAQQIYFGKHFYGFGSLRGNWPLGEMHPSYIPNWTNEGLKEITVSYAGRYAFMGWKNLEKVTILQNAPCIVAAAFYECTSLKEIVIPSSCIAIYEYAFARCYSLKQVQLPSNLTSISDYAFSSCTSLTNINLPGSLTSFGHYVFHNCPSLALNEYQDGYYFGIGNNPYSFFKKPKNLSISSINFHPDCFHIDDEAFSGCADLTSLEIPSYIKRVGLSVFEGCDNLNTLTIDVSSNTFLEGAPIKNLIAKGSGATHEAAYAKMLGLIEVKLSDDITILSKATFYHCDALSSINLPNNLKTIEYGVFSYCNSLSNIHLPESLETIGESAFSYCSSLGSVIIPNSVTSISKYAFFKTDATIYCRAASKPSGWDKDWAYGCKVIWGYTGE